MILAILCTVCGRYAETDTIGEQLLKQMQLGSSSWSGCNWGAVRSDHTRLVLARNPSRTRLLVRQSRGPRAPDSHRQRKTKEA